MTTTAAADFLNLLGEITHEVVTDITSFGNLSEASPELIYDIPEYGEYEYDNQ